MKHLTVQKISEVTGGEYCGPDRNRETTVSGAVRDNREVKPGNIFVCIKGERTDGHLFANSAFESGAACCLAERIIPDASGPYILVDSTLTALQKLSAYYRQLFDIPVIGITGSVGKTTTKEMIAAVLGEKYNVLKTPANLNNELGVPLTLMSLNERHTAAVIEMGISEFGEMSRLAEMVRPDIFVITKIGYSHTESLGSLEGVLKAKSEAFSYMSPEGAAILNGDDDLLWEYDPGIRKITFGLNERNDVRAENICANGTDSVSCDIASNATHGTACNTLHAAALTATIPSYGYHLPYAALPAAVIGQMLDLNKADIIKGFKSYIPVSGRAVVSSQEHITLIDDCYNANPHSVEAALKSLSELGGRHVAILGDMLNLGETSQQLHHSIGVFAAQCGIDCLICCGEKARFVYEGFTKNITDSGSSDCEDKSNAAVNDNTNSMSGSGKAYSNAYYFETKADLTAALDGIIKTGDALLVKASHSMQFDEIVDYLSTQAHAFQLSAE